MAYIGKPPNTAIVNQATSQSFSGNGSTTAFTLTRSVNVGEDLEVFVNNVQQEPGSGKSYTASGTTLTFDEAPPSGTNNVYVIYRGEATINPRLEHDANNPLAATTGTFSGAVSGTTGTFTGDLTVDTNTLKVDSTNNRVGVGTAAPDNLLTISGGDSGHSWSYDSGDLLIIENNDSAAINIATPAANSANILFSDANARGKGRIAYTHSSDKMEFMTDGVSNTRMTIDASGRVIMPNQVAMAVGLGADFSHGGSGTNKITGWARQTATDGFRFSSSRSAASMFPEGSDSDDNRFVAPADGLYLMFFKPDTTVTLTTNWYITAGINGATRTLDIIEDIPHYSNSGFYCPFLMELQTDDYVQLYTAGGSSYGLRGSSSYHQYHTWWYITKIA